MLCCGAACGIDDGCLSRSGIVLYYAGTPVCEMASKQTLVTKSGAEAELVSLFE